MENVTIEWHGAIPLRSTIPKNETIDFLDERGFYAFVCGTYNTKDGRVENQKLMYIGQAYDQILRERIPQEHDADECIEKYRKSKANTFVWVKVAKITASDVQTRTKALYDDIEACLINKNQPECNELSKETYQGREIQITCTGGYNSTILRRTNTCKPEKK